LSSLVSQGGRFIFPVFSLHSISWYFARFSRICVRVSGGISSFLDSCWMSVVFCSSISASMSIVLGIRLI
jgi:hypothetical protein